MITRDIVIHSFGIGRIGRLEENDDGTFRVVLDIVPGREFIHSGKTRIDALDPAIREMAPVLDLRKYFDYMQWSPPID